MTENRIMKILACLLFVASANSAIAQKPKTANVSLDRGKLVYQQVCLTCHQADGSGVPTLNPPLIKSSWVAGDKKKIIDIVLKGFAEKVRINGSYFSNTMPAQSNLTDQQITDVLTYIRSNFGNKASAVSIKEVAAQRKLLK